MQKLTNQQIQTLYAFTQKKYVPYYDLQCELVDHLACEIEAQWELDTTVSFEQALDNTYKSFGIFGFTELVEKQQSKLHQHYLNIIFREVIKFTTLPKVIIAFGLYVVFELINTKIIALTDIEIRDLARMYAFTGAILALSYSIYIHQKIKHQPKKWLLNKVKSQLTWLVYYFVYMIPFFLAPFMFFTQRTEFLSLYNSIAVLTVWCLIAVVNPGIDIKLDHIKKQLLSS